MKTKLTNTDIERQDFVDNAIHQLLIELSPLSDEIDGSEVDWDMEYIGEIRDIVQSFLVEKHNLMTEQEFYPFLETESALDTNEKKGFVLTDEEVITVLNSELERLDADDIAYIAGDWLGGECWYDNGAYIFIPDEFYMGAFDSIAELAEIKIDD